MAYRVAPPVEGVPTEGRLSVAPGRRCPYRGGRPGRVVSYRGAMLPDPKGMANPVPRDADYPIPTVVGRVRYWGYGCAKEVLSDVVRL